MTSFDRAKRWSSRLRTFLDSALQNPQPAVALDGGAPCGALSCGLNVVRESDVSCPCEVTYVHVNIFMQAPSLLCSVTFVLCAAVWPKLSFCFWQLGQKFLMHVAFR